MIRCKVILLIICNKELNLYTTEPESRNEHSVSAVLILVVDYFFARHLLL